MFVDNLDFAYLEDRGQQPVSHMREVFEVFGEVRQLRLFTLLGAACVQFDTEGQATNVSRPATHGEVSNEKHHQ